MGDKVVIDVKEKLMEVGGGKDDSSSTKKHAKKPKYSKFTQQELPACKPILTPALVIATFALLAFIFIPIGLVSLSASRSVVEVIDRYDADCVPSDFRNQEVAFIQSSTTSKSCLRRITVPKLMKSPVFIYYQLDTFYQNHRRYVKSRDDQQLMSRAHADGSKDCEPERYMNQDITKPIVPCGLVAWSMFNDTFRFFHNDTPLKVNRKNIAWESDRKHKFGSDVYPKNFQNSSLIGGAMLDPSVPLSEQEDLMVWMRTAALPTFRKLYGRIEEDLQANEVVVVELQNNYNSYMYGGKKKLVLSTSSWIGGKNDFLGIAYLIVGGLSLILTICFLLIYMLKPRPLGDPSYLSWNVNPEGLKG